MTEREFTERCADELQGLMRMAAQQACDSYNWHLFVEHMLEQDSDEGSRSGTKRVLGSDLYNELQKFKTEK